MLLFNILLMLTIYFGTLLQVGLCDYYLIMIIPAINVAKLPSTIAIATIIDNILLAGKTAQLLIKHMTQCVYSKVTNVQENFILVSP